MTPFDEDLDLTGVPCPQNAARTLMVLAMMDDDEVLRITVDDGEPIDLVPGSVELDGHRILEMDPDGKVVWEINETDLPGNPLRFVAGMQRLPNGNTLIAAGDAHRIVEVDPKGEVVWEINENDLPGNPLRFVAGMQRLPDGNTLVCNWGGHGHVGQQPQVFEVTRDKKVVGEIFDFQQFSTLSGVFLMGLDVDPAQFEILR